MFKKWEFIVESGDSCLNCKGQLTRMTVEARTEDEAVQEVIDQLKDEFAETIYVSKDMGHGWRLEKAVAGRLADKNARERNDGVVV